MSRITKPQEKNNNILDIVVLSQKRLSQLNTTLFYLGSILRSIVRLRELLLNCTF